MTRNCNSCTGFLYDPCFTQLLSKWNVPARLPGEMMVRSSVQQDPRALGGRWRRTPTSQTLEGALTSCPRQSFSHRGLRQLRPLPPPASTSRIIANQETAQSEHVNRYRVSWCTGGPAASDPGVCRRKKKDWNLMSVWPCRRLRLLHLLQSVSSLDSNQLVFVTAVGAALAQDAQNTETLSHNHQSSLHSSVILLRRQIELELHEW